jgi:membrane peptidoglycan carboxypeptidase
VTKIVKQDGTVLYRHQPEPERVLRQDVADAVTGVLQQAVERGTGTRARLADRPVAGKTGTSQQWRDAWFIGFTPQLVTAVWMGFAEASKLSMVPPATPIRVTGGSWPAEIWRRFMAPALEGAPVVPFPEPPPDVPDAEQQERARLARAPSVRGLPIEAAVTQLERLGLRVVRVDEPNGEFPPGVVFAQSPIRSGSVTVRVSAPSPDAVTVPSVLGTDEPTATAALTAVGFTVHAVVEPGGSSPATVWRQEPGAGVTAARGREVTVWVSP